MYYLDNSQSYKPQTKHAETMVLPNSSQKYSQNNIAFIVNHNWLSAN